MREKNNCEVKANVKGSGDSICSKLSVVDDTKTDMEYNCFGCTDR